MDSRMVVAESRVEQGGVEVGQWGVVVPRV